MRTERFPIGPISANCYIVTDEATGIGALVDPGGFSEELINKIHDNKITELKYILCTHGHFDHTAGIADIKKAFPDVKVLIGAGDSELLNSAEKNLSEYFGTAVTSPNADVLLYDGDTVTIGQTELSVLSTPGHSPGGVCYINKKDRCLFSGDTLFKMTIGRTDLWGGNFTQLLDSVEKLMSLPDDYTVYTGHNIPTVIGDERLKNRYLRKRNK